MKGTRISMDLLFAVAVWAMIGFAGCGSSTTKPKTTTAGYANAGLLVSGDWLAANEGASGQVIIDIRADTAYARAHIPTAISLPITPGGGLFDIGGNGLDQYDLKSSADIATVLGAAGVSNTTRIIVYGADTDWLAGRMFWMLEYLGASDVRMLDGGFAKWMSDGRATLHTPSAPPSTTFTPAVAAGRLATEAQVLAHYGDTAACAIVDSRNASDYATGHIPGAISIQMGDFLNGDLTVKPNADLQSFLGSKGITSGKTIITHCYVGYRSAQHYFIFRLMGYNVSNYDGSWAEWFAHHDPMTP